MIHFPPKCSPLWTPEERLAVIEWMTRIMCERIAKDRTSMPVIAKGPAFELFRCAWFVAHKPAELLEANRAALEKPYDDDKGFHQTWIVGRFARARARARSL